MLRSIKRQGHFDQRRIQSRQWLTVQSMILAIMFCMLFSLPSVKADEIFVASPLEERMDLIFDRSEPPARPMQLQARQESNPSSTLGTATPSSGSSTPTSINTATPTASNQVPSPFDSSLGNNFTASSCPAFFQTFLSNSTFKECVPFSLLLQTSNGFFNAEQSLFRLTQTLDATCNVNFTVCAETMASLAQQIQLPSNCGQDLQMQNPMVLQAYNGLVAYQPLYHAGCLTDSQGNYCFANAVTNSSAPTSSYIYYLPLGVQLPAGTQPACNTCLQNTMAIFATAATNSSMPLSMDYTNAAQMVDVSCGPSFVQASVKPTSAAAGNTALRHPYTMGSITLLVMLASFFV